MTPTKQRNKQENIVCTVRVVAPSGLGFIASGAISTLQLGQPQLKFRLAFVYHLYYFSPSIASELAYFKWDMEI